MSYKKLAVWVEAKDIIIEIQLLHEKLNMLGKKLIKFQIAIENKHISPK